jgi:hypothetical protein
VTGIHLVLQQEPAFGISDPDVKGDVFKKGFKKDVLVPQGGLGFLQIGDVPPLRIR